MAVDPRPRMTRRVEVAGQEIGQEEGRRVLVGEGLEGLDRRRTVTVGAGQAFHAFLFDDPVEEAACAAVGVGDEDRVVARSRRTESRRRTSSGMPAGVVKGARQAVQVDVVEPVDR